MLKRKTRPPGPLTPLPIVTKKGITKKRASQAAAKLGRHLVPTFFDDMEEVDLHSQVCCLCAAHVFVCPVRVLPCVNSSLVCSDGFFLYAVCVLVVFCMG